MVFIKSSVSVLNGLRFRAEMNFLWSELVTLSETIFHVHINKRALYVLLQKSNGYCGFSEDGTGINYLYKCLCVSEANPVLYIFPIFNGFGTSLRTHLEISVTLIV